MSTLPPRARNSDPVTSHMAAAAAKELANQHADVILECLAKNGPLGKDGIALHSGIDGVAVCRRLPELQREGLVQVTGRRVISSSGRQEREWSAVSGSGQR